MPSNPSTPTKPGKKDPLGSTQNGSSGDEGPTGSNEEESTPPETTEETVRRLAVRASGIPSGKVFDLSRGVLKVLTQEAGEFEFTIEFDVSTEDGIKAKTIEHTIMETLRQLGATVEKKETE
jgi:hypothetical protein